MAEDSPAPRDYILAFRTITTILNVLQNAPLTAQNVQNIHVVDAPTKREGQILSALASLLVRADEVAAVVSQPDQGFDVKVITCINPDEAVDLLPDDEVNPRHHSPEPHEHTVHVRQNVNLDPDHAANVTQDIHNPETVTPYHPSTSHADLNGDFITSINPRRSKASIPND